MKYAKCTKTNTCSNMWSVESGVGECGVIQCNIGQGRLKIFGCKIRVKTMSKSAKYLVWWVYKMKNMCLLLSTFCTFQTPLTLLTYSAMVIIMVTCVIEMLFARDGLAPAAVMM